jgi:hypothetical protein
MYLLIAQARSLIHGLTKSLPEETRKKMTPEYLAAERKAKGAAESAEAFVDSLEALAKRVAANRADPSARRPRPARRSEQTERPVPPPSAPEGERYDPLPDSPDVRPDPFRKA